MAQAHEVTTDRKGPTEPLEGGSAGPEGHASTESKPRKRLSARAAALEAAVRLLCDRAQNPLSSLTDSQRARLASYAKDGF